MHTYIENDAEIFPAHFTWKVAEKGFKLAFMMNKLAMINFCDIVKRVSWFRSSLLLPINNKHTYKY